MTIKLIDGTVAFIEVILLLFTMTLLLSSLISAKNTVLVLLGVGIIILWIALFLNLLPYKLRIVKFIIEDNV